VHVPESPQPSPGRPGGVDALLAQVAESAYGVAVRLTGSHGAAAQLLPRAAVTALRDIGELEPGADLRLWFLRILTRTYRASRSPARARMITEPDDTPALYLYGRAGAAGFPTSGADSAARLLDTIGEKRVAAAVDRLPEDYRLVCTFYFMVDLSYEEIARVLEYPVGTVRSRLHRGRKMLQKALWQIAEAEGVTNRAGEDAR
jgi:RNA polymerase sigma-70 factor (ECF subfamily)